LPQPGRHLVPTHENAAPPLAGQVSELALATKGHSYKPPARLVQTIAHRAAIFSAAIFSPRIAHARVGSGRRHAQQ
jgi:hypothetical protein